MGATKVYVINLIKQTAPIEPPIDSQPGHKRPPNLRYVYKLTTFVSLGGFLFGWDQGVMAMIIADERWLRLMQPANDWSVGFVVSIYNIGCVVGALTIGLIADSCGRERTISLASSVFITGALIQSASYSIPQISIGRLILGLGVGAYSAGVPLYISEISPANLRGRIVGINLMILCFGEMVVFWIVYGFYFLNSDHWWRMPLAIQVVPALVLAVGCWIWVPPSPRWLVAEERYDCALEVLSRLHGSEAADLEMSEIRETLSEQEAVAKSSWADMFKGPVLRITLLGTGIQILQQVTGTNGIFYYAPTLFKKGGITNPDMANLATGGIGVVLFFSAWIPIFYFDRLGRKTWLQIGLVGMVGALVGICALQQHAADYPHDPANYAIVAFPYLFFTFFNMSWSSGSWTYAAEIFPISLRAKGNALCTASLWISNFAVAQVSPPIERATGYGLYVIFIMFCIVAFVFVRYALVETRGRSLEEMVELFGIDKTGKEQNKGDSERQPLLQPNAEHE
ncbi:permease of the major facilitator superfamily [Pseudomassariella vexata]|uniref:Permease of the major facilitator superfamily n=1 Tax=Pseudomassariella vexata TaxID=1141098 RepID=A0A1Y2EBT3_9PEZI|nr:permease of the major facilitator superfamily [Pseudomassariella vexata]ORY69011.1 permease of the major facilitator superfamily [Pseudomassariella vexata]